MTRSERVLAALRGDLPDHVPASFWFHFPESEKRGAPMADAHLRYFEAAGPDWLKVMNDTGYDTPDGFDRGDGTFDLSKLETPTPLSSACYEDFLDGFRRIVEGLDGAAPAIVTLFCPYATLNYATGKRADDLIRSEPAACEAALAAVAESLSAFSVACVEEGAWGMYVSAQGGQADRLTPEEHARFVEPFDRAVLEAVEAAPFNLLHVCGTGLRMDPYWTYPARCINWEVGASAGNPTISEGRAATDMAIAAGLHQRGPLAFGPVEELREEVRAAVAEGGKRKFLLAAGCTVPDDVDVDLLVAARLAAR